MSRLAAEARGPCATVDIAMAGYILIVEDEPAISQMIGFTLSGDGYDYVEATDHAEAQRCLHERLPDLILLDWMLPGISGIDFAQRIKRDPKFAHIPIIMLTAKATEDDKVRGLDSGADDYVTKPFSPRELLARVRALLRRLENSADAEVIATGPFELSSQLHEVRVYDQPISLSPTEFRLLKFFLSHPERVFSRHQLLDQVWGESAFIEERTVDVHIRRLRLMLAKHGGADRYIQTIRGIGYRYDPDPAQA